MRLRIPSASLLGVAALIVSAAASAETIKVTIKDLEFTPATVVAHVGDVIQWTNGDAFDHTATGKNGEFDVMIPANRIASVTVTNAGRIDYYCIFHPNMVGTVIVTAK